MLTRSNRNQGFQLEKVKKKLDSFDTLNIYSVREREHNETEKEKRDYGPRAGTKQKHPPSWSSGIMPPPLLVSIASISLTTSSMSGLLSGFASQHFFMIFDSALGQHRGISGRKFCHNTREDYNQSNML